MRTTIDIPVDELTDAMRNLGAKTKREAVVTALRELNRRYRMARLTRFSASCDFDTNEEMEKREMQECGETDS